MAWYPLETGFIHIMSDYIKSEGKPDFFKRLANLPAGTREPIF
jgi:hypothetical protein